MQASRMPQALSLPANYCRQKWRISLVRDALPGQIARVTGLVSLFGGGLPPSRSSSGGLGVCFSGPSSFKLEKFGVYCRGCLRGVRDKPWACAPVPMEPSATFHPPFCPVLEPVTNQGTSKSHSKPVSGCRCSDFHTNKTRCSRCSTLLE